MKNSSRENELDVVRMLSSMNLRREFVLDSESARAEVTGRRLWNSDLPLDATTKSVFSAESYVEDNRLLRR